MRHADHKPDPDPQQLALLYMGLSILLALAVAYMAAPFFQWATGP